MNIRTKEFNVTERELRQILFKHNLRVRKWLVLFFVVVGILNLIFDFSSSHVSFWTFYWFFLAVLLVYFPLFVRMKRQNKLNFQNRYIEVEDDFFTVSYQDGSLVKLRFTLFTKVIKTSNYYFLYVVAGQLQYLPLAAFQSENDINNFESLLKNKRLL